MKSLLSLLLVVFSTACMAQSLDKVDCSTITISPQLDDCVKKQLKGSNIRLKNELEKFEKRTKQDYAADLKLGKARINKVKQAQKAWVKFRDLNCKVEAFEIEEGTAAHITTVNNCIIRMNAEIIKILEKL